MVGMDLIGPLTESAEGYKYCCTLIDYYSKWASVFLVFSVVFGRFWHSFQFVFLLGFILQVILKPLRSKTALEVARVLTEVIADMGVCAIHLSDQGTEFCSYLLDGKGIFIAFSVILIAFSVCLFLPTILLSQPYFRKFNQR